MRISDWSSDVCSSDLTGSEKADGWIETPLYAATAPRAIEAAEGDLPGQALGALELWFQYDDGELDNGIDLMASYAAALDATKAVLQKAGRVRSEERRVGKECVCTGSSRWPRIS